MQNQKTFKPHLLSRLKQIFDATEGQVALIGCHLFFRRQPDMAFCC